MPDAWVMLVLDYALWSVGTETGRLRDFCCGILERGDLESKLTAAAAVLDVETHHDPVLVDRPTRDAGLELSSDVPALPRPGALSDPRARALCLARFAHHELMAVELFAWALLRWPEVPTGLRRGWLAALFDEQRHCRLYVDRLDAYDASLSDFAHSDYFWKQAPAIAASPAGARAFLAGLGLTLEQANLDFTLVYRDAFRSAGDETSARVCQRVHDDEIGHVGLAYRWLRELSDPEQDSVSAYHEAVPFPLSAARAKGRRFDAAARRRAGLDADLIAHVRDARSTVEWLPRDRPRS